MLKRDKDKQKHGKMIQILKKENNIAEEVNRVEGGSAQGYLMKQAYGKALLISIKSSSSK